MITATNLSVQNKIQHGFFGRDGGCSKGCFQSLNCGLSSSDSEENVLRNRAICAEKMRVSIDNLITPFQQHTANVITVSNPWQPSAAPSADALVTKIPGIALAVLTADCVPILFYEPNMKIIAAAHAGWKGAFAGIIDNTINAMIRLGAIRTNIISAIGPCISSADYEVGSDMYERFCGANRNNAKHFHKSEVNGSKYQFDLGDYVYERIKKNGLVLAEKINVNEIDRKSKFFSYRQSIYNGEKDYGRQLSSICINATRD
ncbi:MAG: polyphenol oxidase [Rhodospirillaceae bacterium]|nr:polyphenol oxidase [Rhodospirillaceae bacterium]